MRNKLLKEIELKSQHKQIIGLNYIINHLVNKYNNKLDENILIVKGSNNFKIINYFNIPLKISTTSSKNSHYIFTCKSLDSNIFSYVSNSIKRKTDLSKNINDLELGLKRKFLI